MEISKAQIRGYRLWAHHLDEKIPISQLSSAAGACGIQNSPPGAWETAMFTRVDGCTLDALDIALYREKTLLQAWSCRGVPTIFPAAESAVFLSPLAAQAGEEPWIYTRGITLALDFLDMGFDDLLARLTKVIPYLDSHTLRSKEVLDATLAGLIEKDLPSEKRALWRAPSLYGSTGTQTVGGAAVSFLLRPCAFASLVVFGERQDGSPTFTSYKSWTGQAPEAMPDAGKKLVRKFLHCYGPARQDCFMRWLGCSPAQARRLWAAVEEETMPVQVDGETRYMLKQDLSHLQAAGDDQNSLLLLGAHDPYLGLYDRTTVLTDKDLQRRVWKTVANPGAVLRGGKVIGIWKTKKLKGRLDITLTVWEKLSAAEKARLRVLAEEYTAFRQLALRNFTVERA